MPLKSTSTTRKRCRGKRVRMGQISRDIGFRFTRQAVTTREIGPDINEPREHVLEDRACSWVVAKVGYVDRGKLRGPVEQPPGELAIPLRGSRATC